MQTGSKKTVFFCKPRLFNIGQKKGKNLISNKKSSLLFINNNEKEILNEKRMTVIGPSEENYSVK